jgi:septal ring factor EnvC (AmiA/AmiB activator)
MNKILTYTAIGCTAILAACDSPSKKVEKANQNLIAAEANLDQAQRDSAENFENFRKEVNLLIDDNEKAIIFYKNQIKSENRNITDAEQKMMDDLEQRNINSRIKIRDYKENGKDEWKAFKVEFKHDMDELGEAIKGLTVKNK